MEEKKLNDTDIGFGMTDEAIIETLKELSIKHSKDSYVYRVLANSLDLIRRLQNTIEKQCEVFEKLENSYGELVEEHANLKERYVKVLGLNEKVIAEQKAEIERLTEELDLANETIDRNNKRYERVSIELQKALDRVDYLEDALLDKIRRNEELITVIKQAKQQAVKDTAKEILQRLQCFGERDEGLRIDLLDIADEYGVEVE